MTRNLESCKMTESEHNTFHYNTAFDTMQSRIWIPNPLPPIHNLEICTHTNSQQQLIVHLRQYKISEPKHFSSNMWLCEKASGSHNMHFVGYLSPIRTNSLPHLNPALFHEICPVPFTSSLKLLFSPTPGFGAPLSNYLEVVLYKFHK